MNTAKQLDNIAYIHKGRADMPAIDTSTRLKWAWDCKTSSSRSKFVLVALAERANNKTLEAFPSKAELKRMTQMDDKTITSALNSLKNDGFIKDTGKRMGSTKQVIVYRLNLNNTTENGGIIPPKPAENGGVSGAERPPDFPIKTTGFPYKDHRISHESPPKTEDVTLINPQLTPNEPPFFSGADASEEKKGLSVPDLPSCPKTINQKAWAGFVEHRKELDKPLTKGACFAFWEKLSTESFEDQQAMVDNAVMGGYPMLVKLNKETSKRGNTPKLSKHSDFNEIDYTAGVNEDGSF